MAASSGGAAARRKRPWRKPREAKGPDEPLRTVRASPLHRRLQEYEVARAQIIGALARRKIFALLIFIWGVVSLF